MNDISEKQTIEYFIEGLKKSKAAAKQLAKINQRGAWMDIRRLLSQLENNAHKLYTGKPQTRLQTLALANQIQKDESSDPIIH